MKSSSGRPMNAGCAERIKASARADQLCLGRQLDEGRARAWESLPEELKSIIIDQDHNRLRECSKLSRPCLLRSSHSDFFYQGPAPPPQGPFQKDKM